MPTSQARSSTRTSTTRSRAGRTQNDPVAMLAADHKKVQKMFKDFEKMKEKDRDAAVALAGEILTELTVHTQLEEEIFYPTMREADDSDEVRSLLDEAEVEHASAKDLISQIASMAPEEELYDAKVKVLGEYVKHHIKEEEGEMFPKAKKADLDMEELGTMMAERKAQLMQEMGTLEPDDEA